MLWLAVKILVVYLILFFVWMLVRDHYNDYKAMQRIIAEEACVSRTGDGEIDLDALAR